MATANTDTGTDAEPASDGESESESSSTLDKLATAGRVVRAAFLAAVVVLALIPAIALWFGAVPFNPPPTGPYFAFVAAVLVGTVALVAAEIYDV